jgi:hypothetical protein
VPRRQSDGPLILYPNVVVARVTVPIACVPIACRQCLRITNTSLVMRPVYSSCKIKRLIWFAAPDEIIQEPLTLYFNLGLSDVEITKQLRDHFDTEDYGLRYAFLHILAYLTSSLQCNNCAATP